MSIAQNIEKIRQTLPAKVRLVCVSKYHTAEDILEAYKAGERDFAESRAQELQLKAQTLPKDIHWHFIGHLQRNKAKLVCQYVSMIQSVDSMRLIETLNSVSEEPIDILLEVHIAQEATKTGFSKQELINLLSSTDITQFSNIRFRGLMAMATHTNNRDEIQHEFHEVKLLFDYIKTTFFPQSGYFDTLSMGMSDDYDLAIEEGCNMVRIGSRIFS